MWLKPGWFNMDGKYGKQAHFRFTTDTRVLKSSYKCLLAFTTNLQSKRSLITERKETRCLPCFDLFSLFSLRVINISPSVVTDINIDV